MNYKEKYEMALETIQEILDSGSDSIKMSRLRLRLQSVFPEIRESKDEKIRKEIIKFLELPHPQFVGKRHQEDWLAWLEKQGEQEEPQVYEIEDGEVITYSESEGYKVVEPKFKVGDWIINNEHNNVAKVLEINNEQYRLDYFDTVGTISIALIDNDYHLWTIKDAKDGDVLYSIDSRQPFIYKERPQFSQAIGYCCINKFGEFAIWNTSKCVICTDKYVPATKEQRDFLFKKMKEAGYEWDAEKRELKLLITNGGDFFESKNCEQKPAWSEEDIDKLIIYLHEKDGGMLWGKAKETAIEICNILKPQPKQEWTKEDEKIFDRICALIHSAAYKNYDVDEDGNECGEYANIKEWFKKLKDRVQPQITWKPNDTNTTSGTSNWPNYLKG